MKKSFSKLPTFVLALSLVTILLALPSCKSLDPTTLHHATQYYTTQHNVTHDTIYLHDSVYVSELQRGDTVYLTRVEWRDRWRTRVERDTVVDVRVEKEVVELPPERYIPRFHKTCTTLFCLLLIGCIIYFFVKFCLF